MSHTIEDDLWELLSKLHPCDATNVLGDYGDNAREYWGMRYTALTGWMVDERTVPDYGVFERAILHDAYHACIDNCADCAVDGIHGRVEVFLERARAACQRGFFYACTLRPPGHATVPEGYTLRERGRYGWNSWHHRRTDLPVGSTAHGLISYAEPLPEPERYDLTAVPQPTTQE